MTLFALRHFFTAAMLLCSCSLISQNKGQLKIVVSGPDYEDEPIRHLIYKLQNADSVYSSTAGTIDGAWILDSIPVGSYTFSIISDSATIAVFPDIVTKPSVCKVYNISYRHYTQWSKPYRNHSTDTTTHVQKLELTLNTLYGNNTWQEKVPRNYNEQMSGEMAMNFYVPVSRYYSVGNKIGAQYARTGFYNDTSRYLGNRTLSKSYSALIISGAIFNRFTFYNNKLPKDGLKIDLGLAYNFPLSFKQVLRADDDTKIITRHIHRYNDFSAILRIGYKYVGLQAEYRLLDFLRNKYTETPSLKAGLVFYIPVPSD